MNILMIEGAPGVAKFVARGLTSEGWSFARVVDPDAALRHLMHMPCDLILIDLVSLADWNAGFLHVVRATHPTLPILVLQPQHADALQGQFASDPLVQALSKPFAFDDLIAKAEALCGGQTEQAATRVFWSGSVALDPAARQLRIDQTDIELTDDEAAVLLVLIKHPGRACATEHLLRAVRQEQDDPMNCPVDATVTGLRQKLGPHAGLILNVKNYGYRFDVAQ